MHRAQTSAVELQAAPAQGRGEARRIKVCHLAAGDLWAGAEVQLTLLASALQEIPGLDVSVILLNEGAPAAELRRRGIATTIVPESRHGSASITRRLSDHFRRYPVDVLHTHNFKDNVLGILATLTRTDCHRVRTVHGHGEPFTGWAAAKMHLYRGLDGTLTRWFVDRVLAVSVDLQRELARPFGSRRVLCVHNGIDLDRARITRFPADLRRELGVGPRDRVVGTMGRLVPVKGLDIFVRAARSIRARRPDTKFLIAGDGPLRSDLQALAHEFGLEQDVLFLGHRDDGYDVLGAMDVFVLPSLSEGIPMALLEAMALARPVVASRVGGIPEVIHDRSTGWLVPPGSDGELAEACLALLDDDDLAASLGRAGQQRVRERFSVRHMAERVADVYRTLVENPRD